MLGKRVQLEEMEELMASDFGSDRAATLVQLVCQDQATKLALAVAWDLERDEVCFHVRPMTKGFTRGNILSYVSSFCDPVGYIPPMTILPKLVLQSLCKRKLDWDEEISGGKLNLWKKWFDTTPNLERFSIPRCIRLLGMSSCPFQLHVFIDASEAAYDGGLPGPR
ncbi:unnamed protein product [Echinostoma caproni]|uniref:RT_RNaseH_2 domain-containing protein n=1 Tax=Echinostoma caproni TaxID=27848 RepID=A0A183ATL4_9TREM|nr:unnamed protein product [Echinostoma caproni]